MRCQENWQQAQKRAKRIADHIVGFGCAKGETVLRVLDPHAEDAAGQRREGDPPPAVPPSRQGVGQRQPQREEDIHQHLAVKLRLLPRGRESSKGGEDGSVGPGRAGEEGGVEDDESCSTGKCYANYHSPLFEFWTDIRPNNSHRYHYQSDSMQRKSVDFPQHNRFQKLLMIYSAYIIR